MKQLLKKIKLLVMIKYFVFGIINIIINIARYFYCIVFFNDGRLALYCDLTIGLKNLKNKRTLFPHPIAVIIGKGVKIGYDCKIYQGVTIGSKLEDGLSYPTIGNNVTIYANSVIVGDITIGNNVTIGAASLVLKSIPDNCIVIGNPMRILKK